MQARFEKRYAPTQDLLANGDKTIVHKISIDVRFVLKVFMAGQVCREGLECVRQEQTACI